MYTLCGSMSSVAAASPETGSAAGVMASSHSCGHGSVVGGEEVQGGGHPQAAREAAHRKPLHAGTVPAILRACLVFALAFELHLTRYLVPFAQPGLRLRRPVRK